jgi:CheY-like chemotaxis protein
LRRYLLVDDNVPFAENIAEIIRDSGAEVDLASSGEHALALARTTRYDAVMTDMKMPVMSGARLVHEIRKIDPLIPAIVVTAYTGDDDLASARHEGLLSVLPKPVPVGRLLTLLGVARRNGLVAIVEDDTAMSDNLSEALRERGFSAVIAASVLETDSLGPISPFVALVDLRVPGGPAGEAQRRLTAKFPNLPVVIITAFAEEKPTGTPRETFIKPFETTSLLQSLDRIHQACA